MAGEDRANAAYGRPALWDKGASVAARTSAWAIVGFGTRQVVQLGTLLVLARLLDPADFGVMALALAVVGAAGVLAQMGIGTAIVHRDKLTAEDLRAGFWAASGLGFVATAALWISAPYVAHLLAADGLITVLRIAAPTLLIQGLGTTSEALALRGLRTRALAVLEVLSYGFGYSTVAIALGLRGFGGEALAYGHLLATALRSMTIILMARHPMMPRFDWSAPSSLLHHGLGVTLARVGNYTAIQGDSVIIGKLLGAAALGIYGRGYQFAMLPTTIFTPLAERVFFPLLASAREKPELLKSVFSRMVALVTLIAAVPVALMAACSEELVLLLLGPEWARAAIVLRILAISAVVRVATLLTNALALATGSAFGRAWREVIHASLILAGALIGARWGLEGATMGIVVAMITNYLLMSKLAAANAGLALPEMLKLHGPGILGAIVCGGSAHLIVLVLRFYGFNALAIMLTATVVGIAIWATLALLIAPRWLLGPHGAWIRNKLRAHGLKFGWNSV